jgi:phosphonate degradation associated HDIG domain protein
MALSLADIASLFATRGNIEYDGDGASILEHSLQSAQHAERAGANGALVTAALLHDLGHLLNLQGESPSLHGIDDQHQYFSIPFLRGVFPDAVLEPIRLHVDAKRALCAAEPGYEEAMSEDSRRSLKLQGGVFSAAELQAFKARAFADDAMRLRRWDDVAKVRGALTPPLEHFMAIAHRCAL